MRLEYIVSPAVGTVHFVKNGVSDHEYENLSYRAKIASFYVWIGDRVEPDTVVANLEYLKLDHEIKAGLSGKIVGFVIPGNSGVEYGQRLIAIETDD